MTITHNQIMERLHNQVTPSPRRVASYLDATRQQMCRILCMGVTCDKCSLHGDTQCKLTPVLQQMEQLAREVEQQAEPEVVNG